MSLLLDDVAARLTTAGVVSGTSGWSLCLSWIPATPDKIISVSEFSSGPPDLSQGAVYHEVGFQIRGRGAPLGYAALRAQMDLAYAALHDIDFSGQVFTFATEAAPTSMGYDKLERPELVWNFVSMIQG